jgi:hypothetical protein
MAMTSIPVLALALLIVPTLLSAETAVSGRVRELGGIQPISGARIQAEGLTFSALSDARGLYSLSLPEGWVRLQISSDEHASEALELTVGAQSLALPDAYLRRTLIQAEAVQVRARREEAPSRAPIQRSEIRRIAGIGRDPLRALQTLPGVVTPSDFSGQLAVRGGGPQDNLYYLNEVPWPVPFHFGGALSTVHGDLLEGVDLYPAAFPARWGGVDGAILDARSRPPKRDAIHGQFDVNMLLSEVLLEGPFGSGDEPKGAWLISGRRSYFDLILGNVIGDRFTALPRFWDVSVLGEVDLGPRDQLRFTAISTDDLIGLEIKPEDARSADFAGEFRLRGYFGSAGVNWLHRGDGWRSTLTPYMSAFRLDQSFGRGYGIRIMPDTYGLKQDLQLDLGAHELRLGGAAEYLNYRIFGYTFRRFGGQGSGVVNLSDPAGITLTASALQGSAYLQDRIALARGLALTLGGRWQRSDTMSTEAWDPRAALEWRARPSTRLSAGWGLYSQFPTPAQLAPGFGNTQLGFSRTEHVVGGVEQGLGPAHSVKVESYYKTYRDRVVSVTGPELYSNDGEGFARGLELLLKREGNGTWFGWLSLSLAESWRLQKGDVWRRYQYDQPVTLTLVGSYNLSPAWSLGAKLNAHSGPLVTPIIGRVPSSNPDNLAGFDPIYGPTFSERLDDYIRLDLRTDYAFRFRGWRLNLYAEVINALGRPNPSGITYSRDYSRRETVNNLPFLPYLGLGAEF